MCAHRTKVGFAVGVARTVGMTLIFVLSTAGCARSSESVHPQVCTGDHYRDFDFWVGVWNVVDLETGKRVAQADVDAILGHCAAREDYRADDGGRGMSLSSWDANHQLWRQFWVSDKGTTVMLEGDLNQGAMTLTGAESSVRANYLVRGVWRPEGRNVRETAFRSEDGGKTWKPWFDLEFMPAFPKRPAHRKQ